MKIAKQLFHISFLKMKILFRSPQQITHSMRRVNKIRIAHPSERS